MTKYDVGCVGAGHRGGKYVRRFAGEGPEFEVSTIFNVAQGCSILIAFEQTSIRVPGHEPSSVGISIRVRGKGPPSLKISIRVRGHRPPSMEISTRVRGQGSRVGSKLPI